MEKMVRFLQKNSKGQWKPIRDVNEVNEDRKTAMM
jgi:hypothetical protein